MASNQDFDDLIVRIDTATDTLESSVTALSEGASTVADSVIAAQAAATTATEQSQLAQQATTDAVNAASEANDAVVEAEQIVEAFSEAHVIGEAPINGNEYVRQDGQWVLNTGGSDGGVDVVSVNNITPDAQGNIDLPIPDAQVNSDWEATEGAAEILNKPELFSGDYEDLTNKPNIPTQGVESIVAGDGVTVDNTDPLNPVVSASGGGGGGGGGFPIPPSVWDTPRYDGVALSDNYPYENPNQPLDLSKVTVMRGGRWQNLRDLLNSSTDVRTELGKLPDCNVFIPSVTIAGDSYAMLVGRIAHTMVGTTKISYLTGTEMNSYKVYVYQNTSPVGWKTAD